MTLTLEVSEKVAMHFANMPEGTIRNTTAAWLLEQAVERQWLLGTGTDDSDALSDEEGKLIAEGVASVEAGRYRPVQEALADFRLRCAREKAEREATQ